MNAHFYSSHPRHIGIRSPFRLHDAFRRFVAGGAMLLVTATAPSLRAQTPGGLDPAFQPGSGANAPVLCTAIQSDGKILLGGDFTAFNGTPCGHLVRLNADGSLDTTFLAGSGANDEVSALAVDSEGRIIVGGEFASFNGTPQSALVRLGSDGTLDTTFQGAGTVSVCDVILLQSDGTLLVGDSFADAGVVRLSADGSVDSSFNANVEDTGVLPLISCLAVQSDGKVLVGGYYILAGLGEMFRISDSLVRLNTDGSLDETFKSPYGSEDQFEDTHINGVAVTGDGKIICVGSYTTEEYGQTSVNTTIIGRLNPDGSLDDSFQPVLTGDIADCYAGAVALQSDGKIIVGGRFNFANGFPESDVARFNPDGTLDLSFYTGAGAYSDGLACLALQSDGNIVIGGYFTTFAGVPLNYTARLFGQGTGPDTVLLSVKGDGEAVEGGAKGVVLVTRRGDASNPLTVHFKLKGTAREGVDYEALPHKVKFPAGVSTVKIKIDPIDGSPIDGTLRVKVVLRPSGDGAYEIGGAGAKIRLVGK